MCEDADGTHEVERRTIRRARKPQKCSACRATVQPGQFYTDCATIFRRELTSWRHCGRCDTLYRTLVDLLPYDVSVDPFLDCGTTWEDAFRSPPPDDIAVLAILNPAESSSLLESQRQ